MFDRFKKHYIYGILFLIAGIITMQFTESDPPSDPYVIGIAIVAIATFYLLGVGVVHFVGWAYGAKDQ